MQNFMVLACNNSTRAKGKFTLWGKLQHQSNGITITSPLFWMRSDDKKDKFTVVSIPDNYKLVTEIVDGRSFTHIELT